MAVTGPCGATNHTEPTEEMESADNSGSDLGGVCPGTPAVSSLRRSGLELEEAQDVTPSLRRFLLLLFPKLRGKRS